MSDMNINVTEHLHKTVSIDARQQAKIALKTLCELTDLRPNYYIKDGMVVWDEDFGRGSPIVNEEREAIPYDNFMLKLMHQLETIATKNKFPNEE